MPRWVKGFIVAAAAALVIVVMVVVLGDSGGHGPERHLPGDGEGTTSSEEGATPVVDG